jgi:pseudouridine-5'-phosphate glycosidase
LITPFLLKRVNELTGGESSASNVELIKNNAKVGASIAVKYCEQKKNQVSVSGVL